MLHSKDDIPEHIVLPTFPEDAEEGRVDVPVVPDSQAEFLQGTLNYKIVSKHFVTNKFPDFYAHKNHNMINIFRNY